MRTLALLILFPLTYGEEFEIKSYDNDGTFKLTTEIKVVAESNFHIAVLSFNEDVLYKATTIDNSIAIRYSDTNKVFLSSVEDKQAKLIVIGSIKGGLKLILRLNEDMKYEPVDVDSTKKYNSLIYPHYLKLYLPENK